MNRKKRKKGVNIYSNMSYHLFLSFEYRLNYSLGGGKFMCMVRWVGIMKVLIVPLAICGEVCMSIR